jgi:quinol monooxygenase YgiN
MKKCNFILLMSCLLISSYSSAQEVKNKVMESHRGDSANRKMMIRISEIEIYPEFLTEYKDILKEEAGASVRLESGVVAIFPMYQSGDSTQIRILEMYSDRDAYESHLKTPHFLKYKTTTLKMVKSLKLVDMEGLDYQVVPLIFKKAMAK